MKTLEDLRQRCVIDPHEQDPCWLLRVYRCYAAQVTPWAGLMQGNRP
jgi:hypothetical protein